jgi:hypothetical protein
MRCFFMTEGRNLGYFSTSYLPIPKGSLYNQILIGLDHLYTLYLLTFSGIHRILPIPRLEQLLRYSTYYPRAEFERRHSQILALESAF